MEAYFDRTPVPNFYEPGPWYLEHGRLTPVASTYNNPAPYNPTKITFPTPFIHLPRAGTSERDASIAVDGVAHCEESFRFNSSRLECSPNQIPGHSDYLPTNKPWNASFNNLAEDYGHVPQVLLDWMLKDPLNVAQFHDLASCLPGGPSIIVQYDDMGMISATSAMNVQEPVAALTISAENVVDVAGCFNPVACPKLSTPNNRAGTPATASAQVTADLLRLGDSGIKTSYQTSPISQNGVASNAPDTSISASVTVLKPAGGVSEPPREISADNAAIFVDQIATPEDTTKQRMPAADPKSPISPPLDQEWKAPSVVQVASNSQAPFGGMSGPPVETLSDEQTPALLNDWATAEVQPQSVDASLGSGTPLSNDKPATPGDGANENWPANIASLIMDAFGSAIGSAVLGRASPNAESPSSPTQRPPSSVLETTTSARNETRRNTSNGVESGSGTATKSSVEEVETGSPASGSSTNGSAGERSGTESLAVRNTRKASWVNACIPILSILLAMLVQLDFSK